MSRAGPITSNEVRPCLPFTSSTAVKSYGGEVGGVRGSQRTAPDPPDPWALAAGPLGSHTHVDKHRPPLRTDSVRATRFVLRASWCELMSWSMNKPLILHARRTFISDYCNWILCPNDGLHACYYSPVLLWNTLKLLLESVCTVTQNSNDLGRNRCIF